MKKAIFNYLIFDYHVQTLDHGKNKPLLVEETIETAVRGGLSAICLTDHYPLPPDFEDPTEEEDCAMPNLLYPKYRKMIKKAKKRFKKTIEVYTGAEFDWLPEYLDWTKLQLKKYQFDYIIGSVHFLGKIGNRGNMRNLILDYKKEEFINGINYYGSIKYLVMTYYEEINKMAKSAIFDSVGHLDLIKKYNNGSFFSEKERWYKRTVLAALDVIAGSKRVIEINTGGWDKICQEPYPSKWIIKQAFERNIPLTIGSDAHKPEDVGKYLDKAVDLARQAGYRSLVRFKKRKAIKISIC